VASSTHSTPPLHYLSGRESSAESSPISTPPSSRHHSYAVPPTQAPYPDKAADLFAQFTTADEFDSDDILFPDDANASGVVLFPDSTHSHLCIPNDAMPSPPRQIATPRHPSNSPPRTQHSNLTSQLRQPQGADDLDMDGIPNHDLKPRQESVSMLSTTPYGARAIPVTDGMGFRRESHVGLSGSLMGGMSWGGLSMGSFVRDE
jgi:transcription factor SFP1